MGKFFVLGVIILLAWFWRNSMSARELVLHRCRAYCNHYGYQFLDATVALGSLKLRRNRQGRLAWYRIYRFEYSISGTERLAGHSAVFDGRVEYVHLQQADGSRLLEPERSKDHLDS